MQQEAFSLQTKPHYPILDGLRGVAAITVVAFHTFEASTSNSYLQLINHGYLAVDFFFALSGFVIGYAYDDRWAKLTIGGFFKRRLQRLQPMVILGTLIGAICFYFSGSAMFPLVNGTPVWQMLLIMLIGFTLLPIPISWDIRGWQEMHPLDGPAWSLFFEYIANIAYALGLRKISKTWLTILVVIFAGVLIQYTVTCKTGDVIGGWSLNVEQMQIGFTRLCYPFLAGLLLSRVVKPGQIKNAFLLSSILLCVILFMPRVGSNDHKWMNGLFESLSIIFIFPLVIYIGASGQMKGVTENRICKFLGDISYPIYITHYGFIYIYTGWASDHPHAPQGQEILYGVITFVTSVTVGYASLKLYDEPVRAWLKRKWG